MIWLMIMLAIVFINFTIFAVQFQSRLDDILDTLKEIKPKLEIPNLCDRCGKNKAMHTIYYCSENQEKKRLCCKCHMENGGTPSDWHEDCMKIMEAKKKEEKK